MRLAHISDLHLLPAGREHDLDGPGSHDIASAIVEDLVAISAGLDLVVVSGDLTDKADASSFEAFERLFSRVGLPVVVVPGNHDGPTGMRDYLGKSPLLAGWDISNRVLEIAGTKILGLDTCVDDLTQGAVTSEAIALVADEIARDRDSQLIVVMHHPPLLIGLETFDGFCRIERGAELLDVMTSAGRDVVVLSGHVHRPFFAREGTLSCYVAGSMIAPYDSPVPFGKHPIRPAPLQDFYFIHDIGQGGRHVVTPQRVAGIAASKSRPKGDGL